MYYIQNWPNLNINWWKHRHQGSQTQNHVCGPHRGGKSLCGSQLRVKMHGSVGHISRKNPETLENVIQYDQKRLNLNSNWSLNKTKNIENGQNRFLHFLLLRYRSSVWDHCSKLGKIAQRGNDCCFNSEETLHWQTQSPKF